jgi:hypothetical protein
MAARTRECRNAAHESAANAENMNVHGKLLIATSVENFAKTQAVQLL